MLLENKIGIVTGGGSGMGRATALAMAAEGATVVLAGRTDEKCAAVCQEVEALGGRACFKRTDVSKREQVKALVDFVEGEFGRLDLAFNNAGGHADFNSIDQIEDEESEWVIDLNLKGVYYGVKYQVALMLKSGGGSIVNNSSIFGLKAMPGLSHYIAAKFGVIGLTRGVALEHARSNIRVNAICPGATETPNYRRVVGDDLHAYDDAIPMGRLGQPEEIADTVVWLLSDKSRYTTGAVVSVDGGMSCG